MSIKDNLNKIKAELPAHVTLVAVSKTKPVEVILEAYEAGHRDFGENYVQELSEKHRQLPVDIRWHAIGHLQSNKVKYIAPFVHLVHGVDSLKLLQEIDKQAAKAGRTIDCLLQIHIAQEETKFGFDATECEQLFNTRQLNSFKHARIVGFMGMASNTTDESQVNAEFASLKNLFDRVSLTHPLTTLSMGMSGDYKVAVAAGSTLVRIGSLIFGERNYDKA